MFKKIKEWQVLTPDGWSDFGGIKIVKRDNSILINFANKNELHCTKEHEIKNVDGNFIKAESLEIGAYVESSKIIKISLVKEKNNFYDLVNVKKKNQYYTNNIISHNCVYLDEFSKLPHHLADAFITATYPVISSGKSTKIIITSTPLGLNHYHDFWDAAVKRKNNFYPVRVKWQEVPGRDRAWKEKVIRDIGRLKFSQEFGCKFLGSAATLIDSEILESLEIKTAVEDKWDGKLLIYEPPKPNTMYIMGVDTGKGIGKDRSTIQVLKIEDKFDIKQAAVYKNDKIGTYDFAEVCISVSKFYNGAYMMVESNGEGKGLVSTIWYEHEYDKLCNIDKKGLGIYANRGNRLEAHLLLKEYMEKEWLHVCDSETIYELSKYVEVKPNVFHTESPNGFDDLVTALFWALYFLKTTYFDDNDIGNKKIQDKFKLQDNEEEEPIVFFDEGSNNNNINYSMQNENFSQEIYNSREGFDSDFLVL